MFSLFGKKNRDDASSSNRGDKPSRPRTHRPSVAADDDAAPEPAVRRSTAQFSPTKIDAIESEMSDQLAAARKSPPALMRTMTEVLGPDTQSPDTDGVFIPLDELDAAYLLTGVAPAGDVTIIDTGSTQLIDEAAILYANHQHDIAEQMLQDGIREDRLEASTRAAWLMLLDLYRVSGKRAAFEELAVDYAAKFETSPPGWQDLSQSTGTEPETEGRTPTVIFSGKLDGAITKHLARISDLAERHAALRIEFNRVTAVDPIGCGLLLRTLQRIRKPGFNLILAGASELADRIRAILQVGRRDETEAPWLLLLEILRLLDREQEFEEASIDYCVTFEVSPPPFSAPETIVILAPEAEQAEDSSEAHVVMPPVVDGKVSRLISEITDQSALHPLLIVDCSRLVKVEFGAAGQLVDGLAPLHARGARIEFQDVNHLVAALFRVIGMESLVRVLVRKA